MDIGDHGSLHLLILFPFPFNNTHFVFVLTSIHLHSSSRRITVYSTFHNFRMSFECFILQASFLYNVPKIFRLSLSEMN